MSFDDPYDPDSPDVDAETPNLDQIIKAAIDAGLRSAHVMYPAEIVQVRGSQKVDVKINLKTAFKDGTVVDRPILQDVPVCMPSGENYWIKLPIKVGDKGFVIFSDRSLDKWKVSGGQVDPADTRIHHLSDGVFWPGARPFSQQIGGDADDLIVHHEVAEISIKKTGKVTVKSDDINLGDYSLSKHAAIAEAVVSRLEALENGLSSLTSAFSGHTHAVTTAPGTTGPGPTSSFTPDTSVVASGTVKVKE